MMKYFCFLALLLLTVQVLHAENYVETFNQVSDECVLLHHDAKVIRRINGGTVIIPEFDATCPDEMRGPFCHACKIVEEYLYPCMPIRVRVSCKNLTDFSSNSISKVEYLTLQKFGNHASSQNSPMSMVKGVIVAELGHDEKRSFLDSVPNVDFLIEEPDIEITYNPAKRFMMTYSLDMCSAEKYDFISIAVRDILIGLGFTSGFRYNPITKGVDYPKRAMIPFEDKISENFGIDATPIERLEKATKGSFAVGTGNLNLSLYAPSQWQNGVSLNYFIPQDDCLLSQILSYDFCKGMAFRSISDDYDSLVFDDLLNWKANFTVGSGSSTSSYGSTSLLMPYNGSIKLDGEATGVALQSCGARNGDFSRKVSLVNNDVEEYANAFHPFISDEGYVGERGVSVCLLKKDGTWDLVQFIPNYYPGMTFAMSDWNLHYENSEYARTIDGYLRARITAKYQTGSPSTFQNTRYSSVFLVVDYLPQGAALTWGPPNIMLGNNADPSDKYITDGRPVVLYFSDIEGTDRLIVERLRSGSLVPSKHEITDFRTGYYATTIDCTTSFTTVAYNKNGVTRGRPITIRYRTEKSLSFAFENDHIAINGLEETGKARCKITSLSSNEISLPEDDIHDGVINVKHLGPGIYVANIYDQNDIMIGQYKFCK